MADPLPWKGLPCPECRLEGRKRGTSRIGNERSFCSTCNNFAQNVLRISASRLKARYPEEYQQIRRQVETEVYRGVISDFSEARLLPA